MKISQKVNLIQSQTLKTKISVTPQQITSSNIMHSSYEQEREIINNEKNEFLSIEKTMQINDKTYYTNYYNKTANLDFNPEDFHFSEKTLSDHLISQLRLEYLTDEEWHVAHMIIYNLNDDGYLDIDLDTIVHETGHDKEDAEEILKMIQQLDPVGCGASSLIESLIIQAQSRDKSKGAIVKRILEKHLSDFQQHNFNKISMKTGISLQSIHNARKLILRLNPRPGRLYSSTNEIYATHITPDIVVNEEKGQFIARLNEDRKTSVKMYDPYRKLKNKKNKQKDIEKYIEKKMEKAKEIVMAIINKQNILLKIGEEIVKNQQEFFKKGPDFLSPMSLNDLSQKLDVHNSTISRATSNKYIQTRWGSFELKYFINAGLGKDKTMSLNSVGSMIDNIIRFENPVNPYSDQEISDILKNKGIAVERKSVNRYRNKLKILPASKRKKMSMI